MGEDFDFGRKKVCTFAFYIYLKKGNTPKDVGAYVYGIMRNLSLKRLKDRGREIPIEEDYIPEEDNSFERIKLIREIVISREKDLLIGLVRMLDAIPYLG